MQKNGQDGGARKYLEIKVLRHDLSVAAALALPVVILEMGGHVIPAFHHWIAHGIGMQSSWIVQLLLTTLVLIGPGRMFFAKGVPALRRGAADMNALVALGTGAAYAFPTVATFLPGFLPAPSRAFYFEAAAVIVALILLGRFLEARAKVALARRSAILPDSAPKRRGWNETARLPPCPSQRFRLMILSICAPATALRWMAP
ncbi:hypothetical protein [Sulfitobacter sp. SK012]|uniref:hypothetical protein n=1 Tax=Sulfitobacter sp. SK012 TaxID=1389005 RepID=UPI0020C7D64A|nr:hypothetical protein [Sulfitobacter sp. SK012]